MLEEVTYLGYELQKSSFELFNKQPAGNGFYRYLVENDPNVEVIQNEDETQALIINIESSVTGYLGDDNGDDENEKVFELTMGFTIIFESEEKIEEVDNFINDNSWFFENYAHIASKEIADSILQHNPIIKNTQLPPHRIR